MEQRMDWTSYSDFCRMPTNSSHLLSNGQGEHLHRWSSGQTEAVLFLVSAHRSTSECDGCSATATHVITNPGRTLTHQDVPVCATTFLPVLLTRQFCVFFLRYCPFIPFGTVWTAA